MKIQAVPAGMIEELWPIVSPMLQRALDTTDDKLGIDELKNRATQGHVFLWVICDEDNVVYAAAITHFVYYLTHSVLSIPFIGGDRMAEWADDFLHTMERFALDTGCSKLNGFGRKGWGRYLGTKGWVVGPPTFVKDL